LCVLSIGVMSKLTLFLPLLLVAACGGQTPPAETPPPRAEAPEKAAKEEEAEPKEEAEKADTKKPDEKKADSPATDGPKSKRTARDILTSPDVVFMFSFNDSDVKQSAETKCTASAGGDPKKMNTCLANARKVVAVDGYRFKETSGKWWWMTLKTKGKILHSLHKFEVDFGADEEGKVTLKPKGKDLGSAHGRTPDSVTFLVPNEYQIAIEDPKLGKLVYEAKIGIASE